MQIDALLSQLNRQLMPEQFSDAAPNGLQIEGTKTVKHVLCAVSASQAVIDEAITSQADTIVVHHGYFWKNESRIIVGLQKQRIQKLLNQDINLIAYHLPLDAHPEIGNNAMLAKIFQWKVAGQRGEQNLLWYGSTIPTIAEAFVDQINKTINTSARLLGDPKRAISRIAWCTGGAQSYFEEAILQNVDAFITGEVSENNYHLAKESGVAFIAAGHHATERYGIQALGKWLGKTTSLKVTHSIQNNPI